MAAAVSHMIFEVKTTVPKTHDLFLTPIVPNRTTGPILATH
jgi:hypothetical protein